MARGPRWQADRWFWQGCASKRALLALSVLAAAALTLSYVLPQVPAYVCSDPIGHPDWFAAIQVRYRSWTPLLRALGLLCVQDTVWFRVLLAALSLVTLVSLGDQVASMFRRVRVKQTDAFYSADRAIVLRSVSPPDQALRDVREAMEAMVDRVQQIEDGENTYLYGSRMAWASAGTSIALLGLLLVAGGLAIDARWGWIERGVQLLPGRSVTVGAGASHELQLVNEPEPLGKATLQARGRPPISVSAIRPSYQGRYRYQLADSGGPLVQIRAKRPDGAPLTLYDYGVRPQPAELLWLTFSGTDPTEEVDRFFIVSEERFVGRLAWVNRGVPAEEEDARFHLWVFREGGQALLGDQEVTATEGAVTAAIGDIVYTIKTSSYVVANVAYQPGLWALGAGSVLIAVGLLISLVPHARVWSVVVPGEGEGTIVIREDRSGLSAAFRRRRDAALDRLRTQIHET